MAIEATPPLVWIVKDGNSQGAVSQRAKDSLTNEVWYRLQLLINERGQATLRHCLKLGNQRMLAACRWMQEGDRLTCQILESTPIRRMNHRIKILPESEPMDLISQGLNTELQWQMRQSLGLDNEPILIAMQEFGDSVHLNIECASKEVSDRIFNNLIEVSHQALIFQASFVQLSVDGSKTKSFRPGIVIQNYGAID